MCCLGVTWSYEKALKMYILKDIFELFVPASWFFFYRLQGKVNIRFIFGVHLAHFEKTALGHRTFEAVVECGRGL